MTAEPTDRLTTRMPAWLPNAISSARIALVPVLVVFMAAADRAVADGGDGQTDRLWATGVFAVIGLSDVLDGFLARRFGLASQLGAKLDAFADKMVQVAAVTYFALFAGGAFAPVPLWFLLLLAGRDGLIGIAYLYLRRAAGQVHVVHRLHGRVASLLVFALVFWVTAGGNPEVTHWLCVAIAVPVALSTMGYMRDGFAQLWDPSKT